jgi:hypothetical protein
MRYLAHRYSLMGMAALLMPLAISMPVGAAIQVGPIPTNSVDAEQQRILQFHQLEQSFQEQLKVGKDRYKQKQLNRDKVVAAMSSELRARQQKVVIQPVKRPVVNTDASDASSWLFPIAAALSLGFFGFEYRMYHLSLEALVAIERKLKPIFFPVPDLTPPPPMVPMTDAIFFCKDSGADAWGRATDKGFLVLKGSIGRNPADLGEAAKAFRAIMLGEGVLREEGDVIVFEKDHLFSTPSVAASALLAGLTNGYLQWKTMDGMTLDTVQRLQPRESMWRGHAMPVAPNHKPAKVAAG